jgi:serine/threonine protein kinase
MDNNICVFGHGNSAVATCSHQGCDAPVTLTWPSGNKYVLIRILYSAPASTVFLAHRKDDPKAFVIIKAIGNWETGSAITADHQMFPRLDRVFRMEDFMLNILNAGKVPHVPQQYERFAHLHSFPDGKQFHALAMEAVPGQTALLFAQCEQPTDEEIAKILHSVLKVFAGIHLGGYLHRDFKSDNLAFAPLLRQLDCRYTD